MASHVQHLHLLCLFPRESELRAAELVFQEGTDCKFDRDPQFAHLGIRICRKWKPTSDSAELKIGFVSQAKTGSVGCAERLSDVAGCFSADFVVMSGICGGEEDLASGLQHGSVVAVNRATKEAGIKSKGGVDKHMVDAEYAELDSTLHTYLKQYMYDDLKDPEWLKLIPASVCCPSPRYAREMIIDTLKKKSDGLAKQDILRRCEEIGSLPGFGAMDRTTWGHIIKTMQNDPDPWVKLVDDDQYILKNTKRSTSYYSAADVFPYRDKVRVLFGTMGSMECQLMDLTSQVKDLRTAMGAASLVAVDQEAYYFMKLCRSKFEESKCLVLKGISEFCVSTRGHITPFEKYAACTPAAFLRFFVTEQQQHLFRNVTEDVGGRHLLKPRIPLDYESEVVIKVILKAVQNHAAGRAMALGLELGLTFDQVNNLVHRLSCPADHISVIFEAKSREAGRPKAAYQLLEACRNILDTTYEK